MLDELSQQTGQEFHERIRRFNAGAPSPMASHAQARELRLGAGIEIRARVLPQQRRCSASAQDEARDLFEKILSYRNHVGLLSEDLDPNTGELWGNFPQTYSMVGLITSALRLSKSWEEAF